MKTVLGFFPIVLLALCVSGVVHAAPPHYRIAHRFPVPGDDKWDCLASDDAAGRLFVSHGTRVQVIDEADGKLLGTIPDTRGAHAIALVPELNKGFISNGKDTSVTVFDLKTLATLDKVKVTGQNPDLILYDAYSRLVFACNGKSDNITVIDPKTDKVAATIALEGKPEFSVSDGQGTLYINLEDKSRVSAVDVKTLKTAGSWSVAPGESPSGLALDAERHRLFSVCENKLLVVTDIASGKVTATLPIGSGVDGAAFDPALKRVYSSNGEGTLTVIQEGGKDDFKVIENVPTQKGARTLALNRKTHHLFLPTAEFLPPPPAPTPDNPKARPQVKPGTFVILDVQPLD